MLDALRDALGFVDYVRNIWARPGEVGSSPSAITTQERLRVAINKAEGRE
jgi:hypothetical protein